MNLIFLNMDGVLNNESFYEQWKKQNSRKRELTFQKLFYINDFYYIVPELIERFCHLYEQIPDCKIVWTTPWKNTIRGNKKEIENFYYNIGLPKNSFIGVTPSLIWRTVPDEIFTWIQLSGLKNKIKKIAIIDNRIDANPFITDYENIKVKYFETTNQFGLTEELTDQILNYFIND